jgi:hypothetical protein
MGRCSICGGDTDLCCSDCGIESGGEKTVYVCSRSECRDEHERLNPQHPLAHRPTIDEIEALLNSDTDIELDILPNGEVRASKSKERVGSFKVLTMREKLGGEYGHA